MRISVLTVSHPTARKLTGEQLSDDGYEEKN